MNFRQKAEELAKRYGMPLCSKEIESALRSAYEEGRKDGLEEAAASCPQCGGSGSYTEPGHDESCDGSCRNCPVAIETQCDCRAAEILSLRDRSECECEEHGPHSTRCKHYRSEVEK